MAQTKTIDVDVVKLARRMTLHVNVNIKRKSEFKVRLWIASQLIKLAAWVTNMGIEWEG